MDEKYSLKKVLNKLPLHLIIAVIAFAALFYMAPPQFDSNDDMGIIAILSGRFGMEANPDGIYLAMPLGVTLFLLYKVLPSIAWYSLSMYAFQFVGVYILIKIIWQIFDGYIEKLCLTAALISLYSYMFYRLNFTSTSIFLWCSVLGFVAHLNLRGIKPRKREIFLGAALGLSFLIRPSTAYIGPLYTAPLLLTFLLPGTKKRLIYLLLPLVVVFGISFGSDQIWRSGPEYQRYAEFNTARSNLLDTGMGSPNENTEEALKKVGWTKKDLMAARIWWLHDDEIFSTKNINNFLKYNQASEIHLADFYRMASGIKDTWPFLTIMLIAFPMILLSRSVKSNVHKLRDKIKTLFLKRMVVFILHAVVAGMFVLASIRFSYRIAIPLYINYLILTILSRVVLQSRTNRYIWLRKVLVVAGSVLILYYSYQNMVMLADNTWGRRALQQSTDSSFQAAQSKFGEDSVFVSTYILSVVETANPLHEFKDVYEFNRLPEGWLIRIPNYKNSLQRFGISTQNPLVSQLVDNDKYVLSFYQYPSTHFAEFKEDFEQHLNDNYQDLFYGKKLVVSNVFYKTTHDKLDVESGWIFFQLKALPLDF